MRNLGFIGRRHQHKDSLHKCHGRFDEYGITPFYYPLASSIALQAFNGSLVAMKDSVLS